MGNNPYYPEDGDSIWCVFDRDDNSNEVFCVPNSPLKRKAIIWPTPNPSFELVVFGCYFGKSASRGSEDCQALIRLLKQPNRIPDYEKNKDYFDVLKPLLAAAIQRAKARADQVQKQGLEPISRQSNPLTTVWELVEYLNSKI